MYAGKTMAENLAGCPDLKAGQDVVLPVESPIKATGHLQILYGNLCPDGSVAKITGKEGLQFTGEVILAGMRAMQQRNTAAAAAAAAAKGGGFELLGKARRAD
jgi:dihydroxyacid dehydratase/phosphogluconate dehydratase